MSESATAGTYEFRGTAEGDITFAISGDPATVTFTRGGVSDTVTDYPATVTSLSLAADEVLTGTAADLSTLVNLNDGVEGAGTVAVTAYDDDTTELVHIFTGLATIAVTGDVILSNPPTSATDHSYTVASGVTLSAAAGVIDGGETVTGTGNVSVDLTANTDLSGVNVSGIVNAVVDPNENIEITGNTNLDAVTQFFVDTDATLTLNVIQGEKPINGTGDFIVKDDAVAIATTTTEGLLDGAASVIVTGTTDTADLSQITAPLIFDTVSVNAGQTLTLTAAQASGKTIGGQGTVEVLALEATPTADLNGITAATVTATASDSVTFTGDTGDAKVIISSGTFELGDTADGNAIRGECIF